MKFLKKIVLLLIILISTACTKDEKVSIVKEKNIETQMIEAFKEGYQELENGDVLFAAKKFNEAELLYPQSIWAARSALMSAYSYYYSSYYFNFTM